MQSDNSQPSSKLVLKTLSDNKNVQSNGDHSSKKETKNFDFVSKVLAKDFAASERDLNLTDPNASFMYNEIDLSRLDLKRQQDLAALIMDKDKLIEENSQLHRKVLKDYEDLMDAFTLKDLEMKRNTEAYSDLLGQVEEYKASIKKHHEELVEKIKDTENIVRCGVNYSVGLVKFVTGIFALLHKCTPSSGSLRDLDKILEPDYGNYLRELELNYKPLQEYYKRKPKRLLVCLEEANSSYNRIKNQVSLSALKNLIRDLTLDRLAPQGLKHSIEIPHEKTNSSEKETSHIQDRLNSSLKEHSELTEKAFASKLELETLQRQLEEVAKQNETLREEIANNALNISDTSKILAQETESLYKKHSSITLRKKNLEKERQKLAEVTAELKSRIEENETVVQALELDNVDIKKECYEMEQSLRKEEARCAELTWQLENIRSELSKIQEKRETTLSQKNELENQIAEHLHLRQENLSHLERDQLRTEELRHKIVELRESVLATEQDLKASNSKVNQLQLEVDLLSQKLDVYASKLVESQQSVKNLESMIDEKSRLDISKNSPFEIKPNPTEFESEFTFGRDSQVGTINFSRNSSPTSHLENIIKNLSAQSDNQLNADHLRKRVELLDREATQYEGNIEELKRENRSLLQEVATKEARVTKLRIEERDLMENRVRLETRGQMLDHEHVRLSSFIQLNEPNEIEMHDLNNPEKGHTTIQTPLIERSRYQLHGAKQVGWSLFDRQFWKIFIASGLSSTLIMIIYLYLTKDTK